MPALDVAIINQLISEEEGNYRVKYGSKVGYLTILTGVFDETIMCRPHLLLPKLPAFPQHDWTTMRIKRGAENSLKVTTTNEELPRVECVWHPVNIDVLSLKEISAFRSTVHEVMYNGVRAVSKIAAFDWQMRAMERESKAYRYLHEDQQAEPDEPRVTPQVLGHLAEGGRVIGLLLEHIEGEAASIDDLPGCRDIVETLHTIGIVHGDPNRHNFIVEKESKRVFIIDFEHARPYEQELAKKELASLESELAETTGRGARLDLLDES